jgi:hypothetical protein
MSDLIANLAVAAAVLLTGVSLTLAVLGWLAARRIKHPRLYWVALAFLAFAGKGGYLVLLAYRERAAIAAAGMGELIPLVTLIDLGIVLALYFAAWTR